MDETIERDLIGRCRRGEREAFDALMQEHADCVYQLAYRLTANHETADAVAQDTFVQAYRSLERFDGRSRFMTWLYAIAVRKVQDRERQEAKNTTRSLSDQAEPRTDERRPAAPDPVEALRAKELAGLMSNGIMRLPPDQRVAFALIVQEGLSYRDAAQVLNCPEGTLAWRLADARRRLREMLAAYLEL